MSMRNNFFHLFFIQASNYIFPLITLPYLGRTLGASNFGHLIFASAIVQYFILITDYGFSLSATRTIAINKHDQNFIDDVFSSVFYAKIVLMLICLFLLNIVYFIIPGISFLLLYVSFISVIGNIMFPFWFFQGIERVKEVSYMTTISKLIVLLGIFIFVKSSSDTIIAAFFQSSAMVVSGFLSILYLKKRSLIKMKRPNYNSIKRELTDGFSLFLSTVATSFYTTLNVVILGFYSCPLVLGNFGAADKLRNALQSMLFPLYQVIFPRASQEFSRGGDVRSILSKYGYIIAFQGLLTSLLVYFIGGYITALYYGSEYLLAPHYFVLLAPLPFIVSLAVVFGTLGLSAAGRNKLLSKIYAFGAFIHIIYAFPAIYFFKVQGLICSVIITETILTILMIYYSFKTEDSSGNSPK